MNTQMVPFDPAPLQAEADSIKVGLSAVALGIQNIEVVNDESYASAVQLRNDIVGRESRMIALFKRGKDPLNALKNWILSLEHASVDPLTALKNTITRKAELYLKAAEEEKARMDRELKKSTTQIQGDLLERAELAAASGYMDKAADLRTQATMTVAPQLPPAVPTVSGARVTPKFVTKVTDMTALLQAIVDGKVALMQEYKGGEERPIVEINMTVLNAVVSRKGLKLGWPGIEVASELKLGKAAGK